MATIAEIEVMMKGLQQNATDNIEKIMKAQMEIVNAMMEKQQHKGGGNTMVDTRGIGKPPMFKGTQAKYAEWMIKLMAYSKVQVPKSENG